MNSKDEIKKIISAVQNLPTLPTVAIKVNTLIKSPTAGASDLAKIIELDQSLSAKILSVANSAFYGLSREITSIQDAITYIGTNAISQLVISLGVLRIFEGRDNARFDRKAFWIHSIGVALIAREIAKSIKKHSPDDVFTAALLHDIGKVVLDNFCHDSFELVLDTLERESVPFYKAEDQSLGINHSRVGEWVARNWEMPLLTVVTIRHHHELPHERQGFSLSNNSAVDIVVVADWLAITEGLGSSGTRIVEEPPADVFDNIPLKREEAEQICLKIKSEVESAAAHIGLA